MTSCLTLGLVWLAFLFLSFVSSRLVLSSSSSSWMGKSVDGGSGSGNSTSGAKQQTEAGEGCGAMRCDTWFDLDESFSRGWFLARGKVGPALSSLRDADKGKLWSARFVVRRRSELENADSSESNDSDWTNLQVSSKSVSRAIPVLRYEDAFLSPLFPVPMMPRLPCTQ
ncbi:hypothetical protein BDP67DRAFT_487449 [Colletotrichum lupini]|nr:hypothetical protein BDP67DRAFT_487449 [Colletotrichum lupini]